MNILYVEDNTSDFDLLKRALSRTAPLINIERALTCKDALMKLEACTPENPLYDLLLTDMELPDGEGTSLIPFLQEHNLPMAVVIITGMGSEEAAVAALKAGVSDYVAKRGDYLSRLPDILETALHRYQAEMSRRPESLRVLYIEHDATDIDLTVSHFSHYAPYMRLEIIRSAEDVLERMPSSGENDRAIQNICDVLLIDYHLPNMNGIKLLRELLEVRHLELPIVMLAEHADKESVMKAFRLGAMDYVVKHPAYLHQLVGVLENAFHRGQLAREQKALKASEEYFRSLIENNFDIILVFDDEGIVRYASPSFERSLGYRLEEIVGTGGHGLVHPDDRLLITQAIVSITAGPGIKGPTIELRIRHKDGTWHYMEASGRGVPEKSGRNIAIVNLHDITGRKQIEAALKESEERYRTFINSTSDMVFLKDDRFQHLFVNKELASFFGKREEEIIGKTDFELMPEEDARNCRESDIQALQTSSVTVTEETTKNGIYETTKFPVHLSGNRTGIGGLIRDITARVLAEQTIIESERSLQAIFSASPIGMGQIQDRTIEWVNEVMCRISAYTFEELKGQSIRIFHESDEEFERVCKSLDNTGQAEYMLVKKDGTKRDVFVQISSAKGRVHIFTVTDTTRQKEAERALRKSEVLYRTLVETSSEVIMLNNANRKRTYVSPNITKVLGYSIDEFLIGDQKTFMHPDSVTAAESARLWAMEHPGESITFETRNRHKDGSWRWFESTARNLVAEPNVNTMVMNLRDITERKEAEEALMESETKYRMVVENSLIGFYIIQDSLFRFVNKRFCEIFGYIYEEIVDKLGPIDLTYSEDAELVKENINKRLTGVANNIEYEFRTLRKNGALINVKVLGNSIMFNGRPAVTGTIIDITREKTLEAQLRQAQKMEAIGTLAGGVAHDFNNILTALTGYGTLLQLRLDKNDPLQRYVDQILSASMKGASLTRSLLAFSRKQPITLNPVNLNNIIRGTEELLKRLLTEDIILKTILTSDDTMIIADSTQIDQILFNLVTNARDAMPKGGSLTIETQLIDLDIQFLEVHGFGQPGKYVLLSISDTGIGMDKAVKEHIFDPFFTTKEVGKGTGLGLSTVYGIVKQHNGYITTYSEPDMGTIVRIYIPLTTMVVEADKPSPISIKGGKETILVAEDDQGVRYLIKNILAEFGYTIVEAKDGEDAIRKYNKHGGIDLLVFDSVMPKMNGRTAYDEICKTNPHIKVIFTSGYTRDVVLDKGIEDKQFVFIAKPLSPKDLLEKVRAVLDENE